MSTRTASLDGLTERQVQALAGKLPLAEFEAEAWGMWDRGFFSFDPLAELVAERPSGLELTDRGRKAAQLARATP